MNSAPLTTGHTASDSSACGMRAMAALPMGWIMSESRLVSTSGTKKARNAPSVRGGTTSSASCSGPSRTGRAATPL